MGGQTKIKTSTLLVSPSYREKTLRRNWGFLFYRSLLWSSNGFSPATLCQTYQKNCLGISSQLGSQLDCPFLSCCCCLTGAGPLASLVSWAEASTGHLPAWQKGPVWRWSSSQWWSWCCASLQRLGLESSWCAGGWAAQSSQCLSVGSSWAPKCPARHQEPASQCSVSPVPSAHGVQCSWFFQCPMKTQWERNFWKTQLYPLIHNVLHNVHVTQSLNVIIPV